MSAAATSQFPPRIEHSIEGLPKTSRLREIYPDDIFPNGDYAPLLYGRVRYWLLGPEDGTRVVLIHGISTPAITWIHVAPYLADAGFRVLVYDLYGKGYSEAPRIKYDTALFVTQLALLLQYVRWDSTNIVGFSMGGGIAAAFTASMPHLVAHKVVLMSSAGLLKGSPPSRVPGGVAIERFKEVVALQKEELPGYPTSLQSCFTDGPLRGLESSFSKLSGLSVGPEKRTLEVLIIHGTEDRIVHCGESLKIQQRVPDATSVTLEGAGHDLTVKEEHWKQVAQSITDFLHNPRDKGDQ